MKTQQRIPGKVSSTFLQLLITVDKKPTINIIQNAMERPTTTSMLFLDAMYRCKIKVICGSFCFPDQRNEEHPFDTVRYSVYFVFSPGDEAPRVFTIPKPQDVLWSVVHYLTLTKNKSTFARINILGQVILSLCCLSSKIIFSLPSEGGWQSAPL